MNNSIFTVIIREPIMPLFSSLATNEVVDCFLILVLLIPVILLSAAAAAACEITSAGDAGWRWVEQRNPVSCSQECYTALQHREHRRSTLQRRAST